MNKPDRNTSPSKAAFFIGFLPPDPALRRFLIILTLGVFVFFSGLGALIAANQDDPGDGAFRWDWGRQTVTGIIQKSPYPLVHILESDRFPEGHTLMLTASGKRGVQDRVAKLDGKIATLSGIALNRGDLNMLQLRGGKNGLAPLEKGETTNATLPTPVPLGRWRLTGEICDGKCYAGAMRPGVGLAHKACANLCLEGGVPPVFVTTSPVEGETFMLLATQDGQPITDQILDKVAVLVTLEGDIERHGDLLILKVNPADIDLTP